jgi:uncharacterized membrane protein YfcA
VTANRALVCLMPPLVWLAWYLLPDTPPLWTLNKHWPISMTMILGSFVAGATSESGGSVAFPVFTKLLAIPAAQAKIFSLAIQSVGMGSALVTIMLLRIRVEWRAVFWAVPGAVAMLPAGFALAEQLPASGVRMLFTVVQSSFALSL